MLPLAPYAEQVRSWPGSGKHILAHFDDASLVVYQAFCPSIAEYAVSHQRFGGDFRLTRMSWIKPGFLWMMHRSGWASKPGQERVLAVRLRRDFFERLLGLAVCSAYSPEHFPSQDRWQEALRGSSVRLQWDPDHDPSGAPLARRALQLGLRDALLEEYASTAILEILDITDVVVAQHRHAVPPYARLSIPLERVFTPRDASAARAILPESP